MQLSKEESAEDPAISKPNLTQCQPERKSAVINDGGKTVTEQESKFARVFAQLRGEKRELVF